MPTFSQSLEQSLHRALAIANERHHQYATLEHLLLVLAALLLNAAICGVLSGPNDRYQARVAWLLPLMAAGLMARSRQPRAAAP